ncbi:MAG: NADH-quinone oxidoreductase subunit M [Thermoflavifilum sp.]|nr:NADH-quinone oxidoreductase subunit M [Thermoflavifilum sp.]MCL6513204.1 NADH-quinone oxidoreductase subunit M [Alicyclobacillus sp.]
MGLVAWSVAIPLLAGLVTIFLPSRACGVARALSLVSSLLTVVLAICVWVLSAAQPAGFHAQSSLPWFTLPNLWQGTDLAVHLSFGVDALSLPIWSLAILISAVAAWAAATADDWRERGKLRFLWLDLGSAGVIGVFAATDLFTLLVAVELTLVSAFFLVHLFSRGAARGAALQLLIYRGLASVFLITAIVGMAYGLAGGFGDATVAAQSGAVLTFDIPKLLSQHVDASVFPAVARSWLFLLLLLGVFMEEALVPLHSWYPAVTAGAERWVNLWLGGIVTKTGAYLLLRFGAGLLPDQVQHWGALLGWLGVINILYGAFAAWGASGWRRLVTFSSISHMGLFLLGVASATTAGAQGAMFLIISSGLLTALLFFLAGGVEARVGTERFDKLGGLSSSLPLLSGFLLTGALGALGLPLTSGFISEIQAFMGSFRTYPGLSFVALLGLILSAVYLLYAMERTTFGRPGPALEATQGAADLTGAEWVPVLILTAMVLLVGVWPSVLGHWFNPAAGALLRIGG